MAEKTVFQCDGCDQQITTPQPAITMFADGRFAHGLKAGNYHCCSVSCLISFADKIRDTRNPAPPAKDTGGIRP